MTPKLLINEPFSYRLKVSWRSPSNIALIKYWGKRSVQLPCNPSVSFTLNNSLTQTSVECNYKSDSGILVDFFLDGLPNKTFEHKIIRYFESLLEPMPYLSQLQFTINSHNTFPHSAGIASSASAMSALALCLCSIEQHLFNTLPNTETFLQRASSLARIGSGSAARSIYSKAAVWGSTPIINHSSDLYAVPFAAELHQTFTNYRNAILIISTTPKSISSRQGHSLMEENPFAKARYEQAHQNFAHLISALRNGDHEKFIQITETEALTLHALMMTSGYTLLLPQSLFVIQKIKTFREQTGIPICFTLDAGPNVHILYDNKYLAEVDNFIESELKPHCEEGLIIKDKVGNGAQIVTDLTITMS